MVASAIISDLGGNHLGIGIGDHAVCRHPYYPQTTDYPPQCARSIQRVVPYLMLSLSSESAARVVCSSVSQRCLFVVPSPPGCRRAIHCLITISDREAEKAPAIFCPMTG